MKRLKLLVAAVALATASVASAQHSIDRVMFLNRSTGGSAFGYLNELNGGFVQTYSIPGQSELVGVTDVINTRAGILFYNKATGRAVIEATAANGYPALGAYLSFSPNWDKIVAVGNSLFFYSQTGMAAVGHITPDLKFVQTQSFAPGSFGKWTHIVPTDEHLFFYNASNGAGAVGFLSPGGWLQTDSIPAGSFALNWSYIQTTGKHILFYNQQSGLAASSYIDAKGKYSYINSFYLPAGYSKLWRHNEYIVLHDANKGDTTIGYFDRNMGSPFTVTDTINLQSGYLGTGFYLAASTGEDVMLYSAYSDSPGGRAIVAHVDRTGQWVTTHTISGLSPWSFLVSSTP